jgi:hypothetical protein
LLYEEIDASSLVKIDVDGSVLFNASDYGIRRRLRHSQPHGVP